MKLEEYFQLCAKQAAESENRLAYTEFIHVLIDSFIFIQVHCYFARVERKVCYRLRKNVQKNFGLIPVVFTKRDGYSDGFFIRDEIIPGFTIAKVGDVYVNYIGGYNQDNRSLGALTDFLCQHGYKEGDWGSYQDAYSKLYKRPYWLDFQAAYTADNEKEGD